MKNGLLETMAWVQGALSEGEEGQGNFSGGGGVLWLILIILGIIAVGIYIFAHISTK